MRHSSRAQAALARLPEVDPAIAALALWCIYRDTPGDTHTAGDTIYLGPAFPRLPISEQTGLLAHHVLHVALRHSSRRSAARQRYGALFQAHHYDLACDALVNEALLQSKHALPRPAVRAAELVERLPDPQRFDNILAEWDSDRLYAALAEVKPGPGDQDGPVERYAAAQGFTPDLGDSDPETAEPEVWAARVEEALRAGRRAGRGARRAADRSERFGRGALCEARGSRQCAGAAEMGAGRLSPMRRGVRQPLVVSPNPAQPPGRRR